MDINRNNHVTMTSAEANKYLKKLNEEREALLRREFEAMTFIAALGEDPESARTDYDYGKTQETLKAINLEIRTVKHALNVFNTTTRIPEFDMTIDEMLVWLPQLRQQRDKLFGMKNALEKSLRKHGRRLLRGAARVFCIQV